MREKKHLDRMVTGVHSMHMNINLNTWWKFSTTGLVMLVMVKIRVRDTLLDDVQKKSVKGLHSHREGTVQNMYMQVKVRKKEGREERVS